MRFQSNIELGGEEGSHLERGGGRGRFFNRSPLGWVNASCTFSARLAVFKTLCHVALLKQLSSKLLNFS
jgi:hypothetical protein